MRALMLLALVGSALAAPKTVNRIVGGEEVTVDKYPFIANMQYGIMGIWWMQYCGGSLLTNNLILSAAHCYEGDVPSDWRVRLGTSFASSGGTVHLVSRLTLHPSYDVPVLDNDVALVWLASNAVYSDTVQPARIAGINYIPADGTQLFTAGWGILYSGSFYFPEHLRHVDVNVVNQQLCAERYAALKSQAGYENWPDISDSMICAGILDIGGKDACQGDSGGPLVHDGDVIVGVTSWGAGCGHPVYPGVSARVSYYSDWIVANAN